jgi:hypothetical protein
MSKYKNSVEVKPHAIMCMETKKYDDDTVSIIFTNIRAGVSATYKGIADGLTDDGFPYIHLTIAPSKNPNEKIKVDGTKINIPFNSAKDIWEALKNKGFKGS